jgi:hypothetical protein
MPDATKTTFSSMPSLFYGARVRMSRLGRERHPKYGDREGLIVGRGTPSSWRVKFDDRKTIQAIHRGYLELAVQSPGASPQVFPGVPPEASPGGPAELSPHLAPRLGPRGEALRA